MCHWSPHEEWRSKEAARAERLFTEQDWVVNCENVIRLRGFELGLLIVEKWLGRWGLVYEVCRDSSQPQSPFPALVDCWLQTSPARWSPRARWLCSWSYPWRVCQLRTPCPNPPGSWGPGLQPRTQSGRRTLTSITVTEPQLLQLRLCWLLPSYLKKMKFWLTGWWK